MKLIAITHFLAMLVLASFIPSGRADVITPGVTLFRTEGRLVVQTKLFPIGETTSDKKRNTLKLQQAWNTTRARLMSGAYQTIDQYAIGAGGPNGLTKNVKKYRRYVYRFHATAAPEDLRSFTKKMRKLLRIRNYKSSAGMIQFKPKFKISSHQFVTN